MSPEGSCQVVEGLIATMITRGSASKCFAISTDGFMDIMMRGLSLINAKLQAIHEVQNGQNLCEILDHRQ